MVFSWIYVKFKKNLKYEMKISKQLQKLKNLNVKAENCLTRGKAKKIISKAIKAQSKITF